ncbi:polysaccharide deacetylase family protein [Prosthecobacter sp.]|uniref:polysaccharide deacetylase family protein n=1 Tax=Prosthecobacter sp. TaxID=1965333 RepID=UPI002488263E|nr:polysaccharide deacetylase family protein [Prosthecobacter sp.]MDI1315641.1 polysaccharide deacetylase family protein [Prosthecobacter sp.]
MKLFLPLKLLFRLFAVLLMAMDGVQAVDLRGVEVALDGGASPESFEVELIGPFKLQIRAQEEAGAKPPRMHVQLPNSGTNAWPAADVEVRDGSGKVLLVQRTGIEWFKLSFALPQGGGTCVVQAVEPVGGWPKATSDKDRVIQDGVSGLRLRVAKWHAGRTAALSLRFDDSHPSHLTKAIPILDEYGFRGTFMVNPGASESGSRRVSDFEQHHAEWESLAMKGTHELANHSAHHRGGFSDVDTEAEIGEAAQAIWKLTPSRSQLMALNLGGGTRWETTRTLRFYLDKYHQFDAAENSTGMDDSYGGRVENFRRILAQHIQRGLWCRVHYHYIGENLSSTEANFRAALDIAKEHATELWIAGMADIHKYQTERNAAKLQVIQSAPRKLSFELACSTDSALYDHPLTLELAIAPGMEATKMIIKDANQAVLPAQPGKIDGADALRFVVPPRTAAYSIELTP